MSSLLSTSRTTLKAAVCSLLSACRVALSDIVGSKGATRSQIALAWLKAQKPWIVLIPGTTKPHHLEENIRAACISLDESDLASVSAALDQIQIIGMRSCRLS